MYADTDMTGCRSLCVRVCVLVESGALHSLYYTVMTLSDVSYNEDLCACMYVRVHVCFCFACVCNFHWQTVGNDPIIIVWLSLR